MASDDELSPRINAPTPHRVRTPRTTRTPRTPRRRKEDHVTRLKSRIAYLAILAQAPFSSLTQLSPTIRYPSYNLALAIVGYLVSQSTDPLGALAYLGGLLLSIAIDIVFAALWCTPEGRYRAGIKLGA